MDSNITEKISEKEFKTDVQVNSNVLFDSFVYQTYSSAQGIITTCLGAFCVLIFLNTNMQNYIYLFAGLVFIFYLPISLKFQSIKLIKLNPTFSKPLSYTLNSEGFTVSQGETSQTVEWEKCIKAVSTKQSILVYTGKKNASIFPRKQLEERLPEFIATLAYYMDHKKIKIKY